MVNGEISVLDKGFLWVASVVRLMYYEGELRGAVKGSGYRAQEESPL